ncbi:pseudoazurin [Curvibacter sp. CHRR-16]|uniref:pseudoazurin n=1 Tax=Curvibacter sp. CHRR-16 TaxID=2835872 RepID=UPI001BDA0182|nr:pseudoazurin [Curvibacter sp. CHRR-16]MBT0569062.1 pseudoazurin [Curvibacter sp. CHRR-16]
MFFRSALTALSSAALLTVHSTCLHAAEYEVRMLTQSTQGHMVFEPAYLSVQVGDTVRFVPTQSGHYVRSMAVPDGAANWASKEDETLTVTITHEGLYLYMCPPHLMMGMLGLIQAGAPHNRQPVQEVAEDKRSRILMNRERLDALLQKITPQ